MLPASSKYIGLDSPHGAVTGFPNFAFTFHISQVITLTLRLTFLNLIHTFVVYSLPFPQIYKKSSHKFLICPFDKQTN